MKFLKVGSSFSEEKEPKRLLLPCGRSWHGRRHNVGIKVFFASFLFTKKKLFLAFSILARHRA
jgi:hypothetical protein